MGQSADATVAWGVNLRDGENDEPTAEVKAGIRLLEDQTGGLASFFGFSEECPARPASLTGLSGSALSEHLDYQAWAYARSDWQDRKEAAVPVAFGHYGTWEYTGRILYLKKTHTRAVWGAESLTPLTMLYPLELERSYLNRVLDAVGFTGDRTPQLLVWAFYG